MPANVRELQDLFGKNNTQELVKSNILDLGPRDRILKPALGCHQVVFSMHLKHFSRLSSNLWVNSPLREGCRGTYIIGDILNKIQLHCRLQKCTNRKDDVLLSNIFGDTISIKNGT